MSKCTIEFNGSMSNFFEKIDKMEGIFSDRRDKWIGFLKSNSIKYEMIDNYGTSINAGELSKAQMEAMAIKFNSPSKKEKHKAKLKELGITIID
jgi:hypothetical protein